MAALHTEQALQLFLMSMLIRLRGHEVREVLATLAFSLESEGFKEIAEEMSKLAKRYRKLLVGLEEARGEAMALLPNALQRKWKEVLPCIKESVLKVLPDSDLLVVVNKELDRKQRLGAAHKNLRGVREVQRPLGSR